MYTRKIYERKIEDSRVVKGANYTKQGWLLGRCYSFEHHQTVSKISIEKGTHEIH